MSKTVLITGGGRGIGVGIVNCCAAESWNVAFCGLRQIPTLRSPQPLLAARDLATPAFAGGHWRNYLEKICTPPRPVP